MDSIPVIPQISPAEEALLLALMDPAAPPPSQAPSPLDQARFLARPDIQPHLDALQSLLAFRAEIERNLRIRQAADLLLEVARKTEDLVEKRRAATAVIRLLIAPPPRRPAASPPSAPRGAANPPAPASSASAASSASHSHAESPRDPLPPTLPHAVVRSSARRASAVENLGEQGGKQGGEQTLPPAPPRAPESTPSTEPRSHQAPLASSRLSGAMARTARPRRSRTEALAAAAGRTAGFDTG